MSSRHPTDERASDSLRHAFRLLAAAQLQRTPSWSGPDDDGALRARVQLAAVMMGILPRAATDRLDDMAAALAAEYPRVEPRDTKSLRSTVRAALSQRQIGDDTFRQAVALTSLAREGDAAGPLQPSTTPIDPEAEKVCVLGIVTWLTMLRKKERWTHLQAVVPGEAPAPIDEIYVELHAVASEEIEETLQEGRSRLFERYASERQPVVDVPTMVSRTLDRCVVIGEPGSGKSTLVQWLAWASAAGKLPDFDHVFVVRLGAYAAELAEREETTPIEAFFASLGTNITDWSGASDWLRRASKASGRCLLLLDGWDEVPLELRDTMRAHIQEESRHFVTLITSRPSGLPRELREGRHTDFYRIAGLAPRAVEEFVARRLARDGAQHRQESVLSRIRKEKDLAQMAANPFLLGLLVGVLARDEAPHSGRTLASVYQQILDWISAVHNKNTPPENRLTEGHREALARLSHELLFGSTFARYIFEGHELGKQLWRAGAPVQPVHASRLCTRVDPLLDQHAFLHATLQEFLAATHIDELPRGEQNAFLDRTFLSAGRLIVLEFLAGMRSPMGQACRERASGWLRDRDRFHETLVRLSRLATAGRWRDSETKGFVSELREQLWRLVADYRDDPHALVLTETLVQSLARLDPEYLARRVLETESNPTEDGDAGIADWVLQCAIRDLPRETWNAVGLDGLLTGERMEFLGVEVSVSPDEQELADIRSRLGGEPEDQDALMGAILSAGSFRDGGSVPGLIALLRRDAQLDELLIHAIYSLGQIATPEATDALVDVVLDPDRSRDALEAAITCLTDYGALGPAGRDRLLARVAVTAPRDEVLYGILSALRRYPIRDGAAVLAELARTDEGPPELRALAIEVLTWSTDETPFQALLEDVEDVPDPVEDALLGLAKERSIPIRAEWLTEKASRARGRDSRKRYLDALLRLAPLGTAPERARITSYLSRVLRRALSPTRSPRELTRDLADLLDPPDPKGWGSLDLRGADPAAGVLRRLVQEPAKASAAQVQLAAALLAAAPDHLTPRRLAQALVAVLERLSHPGATEEKNTWDQLVETLARYLAELAPGELLSPSVAGPPVTRALRSLAADKGWLVFHDRILDSEGHCLTDGAQDSSVLQEEPDLNKVMERLPPSPRNALRTYCLMVQETGPCTKGDTYRTIHQELEAALASEDTPAFEANPWSESIRAWYPSGLPPLGTWRRNLNRVRQVVSGDPGMEAVLDSLGLLRRKP